jgi:hypothetical protein
VTEEEKLKYLSQLIVDNRLTVPAIFLLELIKPLSFLTHTVLDVFNQPLKAIGINSDKFSLFCDLLSSRQMLEGLISRIEEQAKIKSDQ